MPWFRLEDSFHSHPKVIAVGNEAAGLYVRCGTYAAQHLTDGFIPAEVALLYGSRELAAVLVATRLWHRARGGWTIHDYLDYNPSREAVENDRKGKAERQRRWREARGRRVTNAATNASGDAAPTRPAPKEAGRASPDPAHHANGRASPPGSPVLAMEKPPWCGQCNETTRITDEDEPRRCPRCHPIASLTSQEAE
jgi:hypothetical protein